MSYGVNCPVCGKYGLQEFAKVNLDRDTTDEKRQALAWIIRDVEPSVKQPLMDGSIDPLVHQSLSREPTPSGKARLLLQELKKRSRAFGRPVTFDTSREWPGIRARGRDECDAIVKHLRSQGLLVERRHISDEELVLSWMGWEYLEPLRGNSARTVFVAMAFKPDLDAAYNHGIKVAIEQAGLVPIRIDKETFAGKICEQILTEVHSAEFVIADFTYQRAGVYFEAGYALALGKTLIWSCRDDDVKNLHFDTRQYPHILWANPDDLSVRVEQRLRYLLAVSHDT